MENIETIIHIFVTFFICLSKVLIFLFLRAHKSFVQKPMKKMYIIHQQVIISIDLQLTLKLKYEFWLDFFFFLEYSTKQGFVIITIIFMSHKVSNNWSLENNGSTWSQFSHLNNTPIYQLPWILFSQYMPIMHKGHSWNIKLENHLLPMHYAIGSKFQNTSHENHLL